MKKNEQLIMVSNAARILEVSVPGIHYLIAKGQLKCQITLEGCKLFHQKDVLELARKRKEKQQIAA